MKKLLEDWREYVQALKSGEKRFSKDGMLILFFSGLLIYVILLPTNNNNGYKINKAEETKPSGQAYEQETFSERDYQTKLEQELEAFLSEVEGIGAVEVLIYLNTTETYIVEKDIPAYQITTQDAEGQSREESKEEDTVYTVNSSGEQVPFISQTRHPSIEGVIIAAEGAGEESVRIRIIRTVMALYGVEANKIDVLERKKS